MRRKLDLLAERRHRLVVQSELQRMELAESLAPWRVALKRAEQGMAVVGYLKRHPAYLAGGVALLAALRPGRAGKWVGRGLLAWQILNQIPRNNRRAVQ